MKYINKRKKINNMIRFINLDNQIEEGEKAFAFYDTVEGEFISIDGYNVFETFEFFKDVFNTSEYEKSHDIKIERFEKLMYPDTEDESKTIEEIQKEMSDAYHIDPDVMSSINNLLIAKRVALRLLS